MEKLKILLAKPGLDGHDVGVKVLAHALIENGFEVIYTGLRKSLKDIVQKAKDHQVDLIGLSILSGTHLPLCRQMSREMKQAQLNTPWIVGGNIPDRDVAELKAAGAREAFPTGTTIEEVLQYCRKYFAEHGDSTS